MSESSTERKLCIACKHHAAPQYSGIECARPDIVQISPVDGKPYGKLASFERAVGSEGCGPLGDLWESIQKQGNI